MINKAKSIVKMPVFKALFTLAVPIIMANLFQAMYQLTDSFWVGRLGGAALAAVSICGPIIFLAVSIGIGFAIAGSTFVAQYFGAKNDKMVSHAAAQTILMISLISLIFSISGFILSPQILHFMGANAEIFNMALGFMRVSFIAIIANFSFFIFQSIMRGIGKPIIPVYIVVATVLLNFILDPLLIFGFGPIPASGPMGAALATLLTQTIAAITGFIILFGGRHGIHLKIKDFTPNFKFIKKAFLIGLPASIEQSSRSLAMVLITSLLAGFGTVAIASYGAGYNIIQVAMMAAIGLAVANGTLVGQNIGAKDLPQANRVAKLSSLIGFVILSFFGLIVFIFSRQLVSFFIPNDQIVINEASNFIRIIAFGFGFVSLHMTLANVFTAAGQTTTTMLLSICSQWIIQIPLAYFLSKYTSLGIKGIWFSFLINNIISSIIAFIIFSRGRWKKGRIIEDNKLTSQVSEEVIIEKGIH
ncbi:MAG: MATE family efflux transporter [Candidatus Shapirobacteria bacterium]|jgi:putative MATE family efflux protein|nr:MATE family efflux transporter [Candidatus Shapirobacteria bacterium]